METKKLSSLIFNGPRISCVTNSGLKISIGVLCAVGTVFAARFSRYFDFRISYEDADSTGVWVVPGLQNLGNNCFLNVVLQVKTTDSFYS